MLAVLLPFSPGLSQKPFLDFFFARLETCRGAECLGPSSLARNKGRELETQLLRKESGTYDIFGRLLEKEGVDVIGRFLGTDERTLGAGGGRLEVHLDRNSSSSNKWDVDGGMDCSVFNPSAGITAFLLSAITSALLLQTNWSKAED